MGQCPSSGAGCPTASNTRETEEESTEERKEKRREKERKGKARQGKENPNSHPGRDLKGQRWLSAPPGRMPRTSLLSSPHWHLSSAETHTQALRDTAGELVSWLRS